MGFLDLDELGWKKHWRGMPEFSHDDLTPWKSVIVHFADPVDLEEFAQLIEQTLTVKTQSVWYPKVEIGHMVNKRYKDES